MVLERLRVAADAAHDAMVALVDAVVAADQAGTVVADEGMALDLVMAADAHYTARNGGCC